MAIFTNQGHVFAKDFECRQFVKKSNIIKMCVVGKHENSCSVSFWVICPMISLIIDFIIMQSLVEKKQQQKLTSQRENLLSAIFPQQLLRM